jgi:very-short-patch-repair endonuclease
MRKQPTTAEEQLWRALRNKQLGVRFRRQHPIARYIVDFYCVEASLAIELDGGGHAGDAQRHYDQRRAAALARHGVRVLRLWNPEVTEALDRVLDLIWNCLRGAPIPPDRPRVDL